MKKYALLFLFAGLLASCRDKRDDILIALDNHIRPNNMAVGQSSRYVLFQGEEYYDPTNFAFTYLADTLVLTVVGEDANGFVIEEQLTPGSASRNGAENVPNPDSVYQFNWIIQNDTLFQQPLAGSGQPFGVDSRFTFYDVFALPLTQFTAPAVDIKGWKTDQPYTESYWTGVDAAYTLFGFFYPDLNILTDNRDMAFDGNGKWYAYSTANGIVKTANYSWWTQQGRGWDLLPD